MNQRGCRTGIEIKEPASAVADWRQGVGRSASSRAGTGCCSWDGEEVRGGVLRTRDALCWSRWRHSVIVRVSGLSDSQVSVGGAATPTLPSRQVDGCDLNAHDAHCWCHHSRGGFSGLAYDIYTGIERSPAVWIGQACGEEAGGCGKARRNQPCCRPFNSGTSAGPALGARALG